MLARLPQTFFTLSIVLGIYALYRFSVVPWIVPPPLPVNPLEEVVHEGTHSPIQIERLKKYFSKGDWETEEPIVIEKPEFALLLQHYENTESDQLEIKPCTFVFFPDGRPAGGQAKRVFIMRAPEGAVLDFEGGCDLTRAKVGRLQGGRLLGNVSITGHLPTASPEAEFSLTTRDVELREDRLWSRQDVEFRIGNNHGRGREMQLQFNLEETNSRETQNSTARAVEKFELLRDVKLFLELDSKQFLPDTTTETSDHVADEESSPVEIQCSGAFRLNINEMSATFNEQVEVVRHHPSELPDQLTCDQLTIYFSEKPSEETIPASTTPSRIEVSKLIAKGDPVFVQTPSTEAEASGNYLEIEPNQRHLILRGSRPATLRQKSSTLSAVDIDFTAGAKGELGTLKATGPGRLVTMPSGTKQESLEATWKNILELQPHKRGHVLSLLGGGRIQYADTSALQAEKIWLWIDKADTAKSQDESAAVNKSASAWKQFSPHSALALENVRLHGKKISAVSDRLEVWFENTPESSEDGANPDAGTSNAFLGTESSPTKNRDGPSSLAQKKQPETHYHIRGDLIQLTIALPENGQPAPTAASVSGNVQLIERLPATDNEMPMTVSGDHLDLLGANTLQTVVALTGKPARATARSASITGASLKLERGTNRIWVNGAGSMQLPIDRDLEGEVLKTPEPLDITWQGKMLFDGQIISFERDVLAKTKNQSLHTAQLAVTLNRPINFSEPVERNGVELAKIACHGGVLLDAYSREEGRQISHEHLETKDLIIEQPSGKLRAMGPGRVTSVRRGSANSGFLSMTPPSKQPTVAPTGQTRQRDDGLSYLRVEFLEGLGGNIQDREITFNERVHCTYGPVSHWKAQVVIDPNIGPRDNQILMTCNQLTLRQMGASNNGQRTVEMEATGNSLVDSETFSAKGHRLTYTTGKELLVLEGTGQSFAQLLRRGQEKEQPSNLTAQKIYFWRADNRVQLEGIRLFNGSVPNRK